MNPYQDREHREHVIPCQAYIKHQPSIDHLPFCKVDYFDLQDSQSSGAGKQGVN